MDGQMSTHTKRYACTYTEVMLKLGTVLKLGKVLRLAH